MERVREPESSARLFHFQGGCIMKQVFLEEPLDRKWVDSDFRKNKIFSVMRMAFFLLLSFAQTGLLFSVDEVSAAEDRPDCPQPRFTEKAPAEFYEMPNPLESTPENIKDGKMLYQVKAKPMPCKHCHGVEGDGRGPMSGGFKPPPRNFTCAETINGVPDGQLFWIIQNGSPGTGMMAFKGLKEEEIWQVILYLRELAAK